MSIETLEKQADIERLHEKLREMAKQQGVKPVTEDFDVPEDGWPASESVDEFLEWVQEIRKSDNLRRGE